MHSPTFTPATSRPALYALPSLAEDAAVYDVSPEPPTVSKRRRVVIVDAEASETIAATLGPAAFTTYWYLCNRARDGKCWPSLDTIAEGTKQSRKHVIRMLDILEEGGWIEREQRHNTYRMQTSTVYTITVTSNETGCDTNRTTGGQLPDKSMSKMSQELVVELESNYVTPDGVTKPPKSPTPKKAERRIPMPPDFDLSPERMAYALAHGMTELDAERMFEQMRVWSKSDGGKYIDWNAAWQKWVLRREEQRDTAPPPRNGGYQDGRAAPQTTAEKMAEAVAIIERKRAGSPGDVIDAAFRTGDGR